MSYDDVLSITEVCKIIRSGTNICRRHNMHSAHSASPQHSSAQRQNRTISAAGIFQSCASTPGAEMGLRRGATKKENLFWQMLECVDDRFLFINSKMPFIHFALDLLSVPLTSSHYHPSQIVFSLLFSQGWGLREAALCEIGRWSAHFLNKFKQIPRPLYQFNEFQPFFQGLQIQAN